MKGLKNMKILIDTNVILDVLLKREPFYHNSANVLNLSQMDTVELYISASAITDIYYIANQTIKNKERVKELITKLISIISIASISEDEIKNALSLSWKDFEDSVQYSVALLQEMDGVVTRNPHDYKEAKITIWTPEGLLLWIQNQKA